MTGQLYYLIGIARSGKSTFAKKWLNYEYTIDGHDLYRSSKFEYDADRKPESVPRMVVCSDDIRLALHGQPFVTSAENIVHAIKEITIASQLMKGVDVLVDGTHTTIGSIRAMHLLQRNAIYVYIDADPDECVRRAYATDQAYLEKPIRRMVANLEKIRSELEEYRGTGLDPPFLKKLKEVL